MTALAQSRSPRAKVGVLESLEPRLCFSVTVGVPNNVFPIGVWSQPASSFPTWKARGVNTALWYEDQGGTVSLKQWSNAAVSNGLYQLRQPSGYAPVGNSGAKLTDPSNRDPSTIKQDLSVKGLLGWMQPTDEPELKGVTASLLAHYTAWKAVAPNMPVMTDFSGGDLLGLSGAGHPYAAYAKATDWVAQDFYPVTAWNQPNWINYDTPIHETVGMAADALASYAPGQTQWAFLETSNQNFSKTSRAVYPQEFRGEFWDAIIHGASGVAYFPDHFNAFSYDATPQAVQDEMGRESNWINNTDYGAMSKGAVASILHLAADPTAPSLVMHLSDSRLEGTTRTTTDGSGNQYFVVLDRSWNNQTAGSYTYSTKQFRVDLPANIPAGTAVTALPDPTITVATSKGTSVASTKAGTFRTLIAQQDGTGTYVMDAFAPFATHIYRVTAAETIKTASIDPMSKAVNSIAFTFAAPVAGFSLSDLHLTNSHAATDLLAGSPATLASNDGGKTWLLSNLSGITTPAGAYTLTVNDAASPISSAASGASLYTANVYGWTR